MCFSEQGNPAVPDPLLPPLAANHRDLTVLCGIDGGQLALDGEVYRCECGNEARTDALEAFALGALAYVGATVIVNPVETAVHSET